MNAVKTKKPLVRLLLAALLPYSLGAAGVEIWSGTDLKGSAAKLASEAEAKNTAGKTLGAYGNHSASLWRRAKSGEAELHKTKVDLIVIEQGSATLLYGGTIPDAHTTAPNEVRGKTIQHGASRRLTPGDIVRIPAGTPHQFILEKGEEVAYFAVKIVR
jgi:mannose-6-phosphate isomerase-like protein (cupin superfamily)